LFFFFQAEDGIRDAQESRGLGDVYKRQQWGIRLSVTFAQHYFIGINTGVAFTPFAKFGDRDKKIRIYRNTIAVTLGYNF